jgi:hypothetical protein
MRIDALECADVTALWNWQTCLPVGKQRHVAALQISRGSFDASVCPFDAGLKARNVRARAEGPGVRIGFIMSPVRAKQICSEKSFLR